MAIRTTEQKVRAVVKADLDVPMARFIDTATAMTDYVVTQDSANILITALLLEIETYLAAHYYALFDLQYASKKTGDASATYQGVTKMGLDSTLWGQQAIALDVSGTLAVVNKGSTKLTLSWLGTTDNVGLEYWERN